MWRKHGICVCILQSINFVIIVLSEKVASESLNTWHKRSTDDDWPSKETVTVRLFSSSNKNSQRFRREAWDDSAELHINSTSGSFEFILNHVKPVLNKHAKITVGNGQTDEPWNGVKPDCFMKGHSKANPFDIVVLSYCNKLMAMFQYGNHSYNLVEDFDEARNDGVQSAVIEKTRRKLILDKAEPSQFKTEFDNRQRRGKRAVTGTGTIETVVILDEAYIADMRANGLSTNESLVEVMTLKWNGVQAEWSKAELGAVEIIIDIKELVLWETNPSWYSPSSTIQNTLTSVCSGANTQNLWRDFDYIYLFTGLDTDYPGKAFTGKMCDNTQNCGVSSDYRINEFTTTAHEVGHSVGFSHDYDVGCGSSIDGIMGYEVFGWSGCSIGALSYLLSTDDLNCLTTTDVSEDNFATLEAKWPGMLYTRDEICALKRGPGFRFRYYPYVAWGSCALHTCINMDTTSPNYGVNYKHAVPTDGTYCGDGMVCSAKAVSGAYTCISRADTGLDLSLFAEVQGVWSAWGSTTSCSRTCGTGVQYRQRTCDNPKPQNTADCEGDEYDPEPCNIEPCADDSDVESELITQRAGETCTHMKSNSLYEVMGLDSVNFLNTGSQFSSEIWGQCEVECDAVDGYTPPSNQRYGLMPDGTPCTPEDDTLDSFVEINNIIVGMSGKYGRCVQGYCYAFGCDDLPGDAAFDGCGVCGGDNSTCDVVEGVFTDILATKERREIVTLPTGAYNIVLYFKLSDMWYNILELRTPSDKIVINSKTLDTTETPMNFANTYWYYDYYTQFLYAAGPIDRRANIKLYNQGGNDNVGINYAYSLPTDIASCSGTCENGGTWNSVYCDCDCPSGYHGPTCVDTCNKYCRNGRPFVTGECTCDCAYNMYDTNCACRYPFSGLDCQDCKISSCANGGVFNETACRCACPDGYGGLDCSSACEDTVDEATCATNVGKGWCETKNEKMEEECYMSCGLCTPSTGTTTTEPDTVTTPTGETNQPQTTPPPTTPGVEHGTGQSINMFDAKDVILVGLFSICSWLV